MKGRIKTTLSVIICATSMVFATAWSAWAETALVFPWLPANPLKISSIISISCGGQSCGTINYTKAYRSYIPEGEPPQNAYSAKMRSQREIKSSGFSFDVAGNIGNGFWLPIYDPGRGASYNVPYGDLPARAAYTFSSSTNVPLYGDVTVIDFEDGGAWGYNAFVIEKGKATFKPQNGIIGIFPITIRPNLTTKVFVTAAGPNGDPTSGYYKAKVRLSLTPDGTQEGAVTSGGTKINGTRQVTIRVQDTVDVRDLLGTNTPDDYTVFAYLIVETAPTEPIDIVVFEPASTAYVGKLEYTTGRTLLAKKVISMWSPRDTAIDDVYIDATVNNFVVLPNLMSKEQ